MYKILFASLFLALLIPKIGISQCLNCSATCQQLTIDTNCTTAYALCDSYGPDIDFLNRCNSTSGWSVSNGTPNIIYGSLTYEHISNSWYALMDANTDPDPNSGEGMFYPFQFLANQNYTITITYSTNGAQGFLSFYAANGLHQITTPIHSCQYPAPLDSPGVSYQLIDTVHTTSGVLKTDTFHLSASSSYAYFWMFSNYISSDSTEFTGYVTNIGICPDCYLPAPTGLGTSNGESTLTWNSVSGAASYIIQVTDNGIPHQLTSTTNSVFYCPTGNGDNVTFTVQAVCPNNATGAVSSGYPFTYSAPTIAVPTGLQFDTFPPFTVSWNAVSGATGYLFLPTPSSPVPVNNTSVSDPDAELNFGTSYEVKVAATNGCVIGQYDSLSIKVPPSCSPAPTVETVEGTFVLLYSVSGAASYNVGFENTSGVVVYQKDYIGPVITTSGYNVTGVPPGSYYIIASTNCSAGGASVWGSPYSGGLQTITAVQQQSRSMTIKTLDTAVDDVKVFSVSPVPSSSKLTLAYSANHGGNIDVLMVNPQGSVVQHNTLGVITGQNAFTLDVSKIPNGVYVLRLLDQGRVYIRKVVVLK
jgi:hypothetical protein